LKTVLFQKNQASTQFGFLEYIEHGKLGLLGSFEVDWFF